MVTCSWIAWDEKESTTEVPMASRGTMIVVDDTGTFEQIKTVITPEDGKWVVSDHDVPMEPRIEPLSGSNGRSPAVWRGRARFGYGVRY